MTNKLLDKLLYSDYKNNWDDLLFREKILSRIEKDSVCLDIGAGAGIVSAMNFRGEARSIVGLDLDERVASNPFLDEAFVGSAEALPFENEKFDLVFSDNVMEHLENPSKVMREVWRVLKPGGVFIFKTPNVYHYMPTIARMTSHSVHQWINKKRGRESCDTFPTRYLCNNRSTIARMAEDSELELEAIEFYEGRPEYLRFNFFTYLIGALYERIVNSSHLLEQLRIVLIATLVKK